MKFHRYWLIALAGVIFHPNGDCFEIWDNVKNGTKVRVSWNYYGWPAAPPGTPVLVE